MLELARATLLDLTRRPGLRLAVFAALSLLAVLPWLSAPGASARDAQRLTLELSAATLLLVANVTCGIAGVLAGQPAPGGATSELLSAPLSPARFVAARLLGIGALGCAILVVLGGAAALACRLHGIPFADAARMTPVLAAAGTPLFAFAALGLCLGAVLRTEMAILLVIAAPWGLRLLLGIDADAAIHGALRAWVPDPVGPFPPRVGAFEQPLATAAITWSLAASVFQTGAWYSLAALALSRGTRTSAETA